MKAAILLIFVLVSTQGFAKTTKEQSRKVAATGVRSNLLCYGQGDFRQENQPIAISGVVKGPHEIEGLHADVGNDKYALPISAKGVTYHQTGIELRAPPENYDKYVWPQESLVWTKGEAASAKKTFLVLPKNLARVPYIEFTAYLRDNTNVILLLCSVLDDCAAKGQCQ